MKISNSVLVLVAGDRKSMMLSRSWGKKIVHAQSIIKDKF